MDTKRNVALAIGIADAARLSPLTSAVNGAQLFHQWASSLGYDSTLLTTDDGPVTMQQLRTVLDKLLNPIPAVPIHRFLLYFAGHGLIREADQSLWLLSDWYGDQRAVAVEVLKRRLSFYDIDQIALFADACRSLPADIQTADMTADGVLGRGPRPTAAAVAVDKFVAAQDGSQAFTIPGVDPDQDQCLFTGVLLRGLWGTEATAFAHFQPTKVTSSSLGSYLAAQVPQVAARYGLTLNPSTSYGFPDLDNVYFGDLNPAPPVPSLPAWPSPPVLTRAPMPTLSAEPPPMVGADPAYSPLPPSSAPPSTARESLPVDGPCSSPDDAKLRVTSAPPPPPIVGSAAPPPREAGLAAGLRAQGAHWPTSDAGIAITGGAVRAFWVNRSTAVQKHPTAPAQWLVRNADGQPLDQPVSILIELTNLGPDPLFVALHALPSFGAFVLCDGKGASAIRYVNTNSDLEAAKSADKALLGMESGALRFWQATSLARTLRSDKAASPLLGVIAAYLYDSASDTESIRQMAQFYLQAGQPVPYDIAMLGMLTGELRGDALWATVPPLSARTGQANEPVWDSGATVGGAAIVGGHWPLLKQGWAFLDDPQDLGSALVHPALLQARNHLTGSRFATLDQAGAQLLADAFGLERKA